MPQMERSIQLKRAVAVHSDRYPAISPLNLHTAMAAVFASAHNVGDRHYPKRTKVKPGKHCVFLEPVEKGGAAVLFHAYAYVAGMTPDQMVADFDAVEANISAEPIVDDDGETREIVHRFACLVLGDALLIENARIYGSAALAISAIRDLIRRHHNKVFPRMILEDAPNRGFKHLAEVNGGVVKVTARLNRDFTPDEKTFGSELKDLFKSRNLANTYKQVSASVEADEDNPIDPDDALKIVEESEGSTGLSGITVQFGNGSTLSDLEKYRERYRVSVQEVRPGVPAVTEIETAMVEYLQQLATPDDENARVIDAAGLFITPQ